MTADPYEFRRGIGELTAERLNCMMDAAIRMPRVLEELEELRSMFRRPDEVSSEFTPVVVAILGFQPSGSTSYWEYAYAEASVSSAGVLSLVTDGINSYDDDFDSGDFSAGTPFNTPAFNLAELGNDGRAWENGGVNTESSSFPDGFFAQPYRGDDGTTGPYDPTVATFWDLSKAVAAVLWTSGSGVKFIGPIAGLAEGECDLGATNSGGGGGGGGGGPGSDTSAIHVDVAEEISNLTLKSIAVGADVLAGEDSANGYTKVQIPISGVPVIVNSGSTVPTSPEDNELFMHTPTGREFLIRWSDTDSEWQPMQGFGSGTTIHISKTGTDSINNGFGTGADAFLTIEYAISQIPKNLASDVAVVLGAGTYTEDVTLVGFNRDIDFTGEDALVEDDSATSSNCVAGSNATRGTVDGYTSGSWEKHLVYYEDNEDYAVIDRHDTSGAGTLTIAGTMSGATAIQDTKVYDYGVIIAGEMSVTRTAMVTFSFIDFLSSSAAAADYCVIVTEAACQVFYCRFSRSTSSTATLITCNDFANVLLRRCIVTSGTGTNTMIQVQNFAYLRFQGCRLEHTGTTTSKIGLRAIHGYLTLNWGCSFIGGGGTSRGLFVLNGSFMQSGVTNANGAHFFDNWGTALEGEVNSGGNLTADFNYGTYTANGTDESPVSGGADATVFNP